MPNQVTALGIETASQEELFTNLSAAYEAIYGSDINLDPETPDAQMMMIYIQATLDAEDMIVTVYNGFDPDNAFGNVLDQRVAINGITRQAGTYSETNVTLVITQSINLFGLDQDVEPVYTIQDSAGNQWQLETSHTGISAGSHVYSFRAANPGAVLTIPNTINIPVTVVLGVSTINNPTAQSVTGINEESDAALKLRRQISVALPSQGYLASLLAALRNINGVTDAFVYENNSGSTNGDGVPSHSIWVIVAGAPDDADVANAIYTKRNAGCGMFGDQSFAITQADGTIFLVYWDNVEPENLFIKFTATSLNGTTPPNVDLIRTKLPEIFVPGVAQQVNINDLATLVQEIDPNTLVTNAGFASSSGGSYTSTKTPATKKNQFVVSSPDIIILPVEISPASAIVAASATKQFAAFGGFGSYTWSMDSNPSGGSVDASTGLYTAGPTGSTMDVVKVTDGLGNFATASVTVT